MNGTINELKQGLLKCANENKDRTYLTGQVIISSICECAKDTIEELEKENERLKARIERMKCCGNCKHFEFNGFHQQKECSKYSCEWELAE